MGMSRMGWTRTHSTDAVTEALVARDRTSLELKFALNSDHVIPVHSPGGTRARFAQVTKTAQEGARKWGLDRPGASGASELYAKAVVASALLSTLLNGEERVRFDLTTSQGDSTANSLPIRGVGMEASGRGEVRGYLSGGIVENPDLDDAEARIVPGPGTFAVQRFLYDTAGGRNSYIPLVGGDVLSEVVSFLAQSDQVRSMVHMESVVDPETGTIQYAGGVLAQTMPLGDESELETLSAKLGPTVLHDTYARKVPLVDVATQLLGETDKRIRVDFVCPCSRDKAVQTITRMGPEARFDDDGNEMGVLHLTCHFCNDKHDISIEELAPLWQDAHGRSM